MGCGRSLPARRDRVARNVEAPVSVLVDRRTGMVQNVSDIPAEIQNAFPFPVRTSQLRIEIHELSIIASNERHRVNFARRFDFLSALTLRSLRLRGES